ncbi:TPA: DUF1642 domain-containing protein [Streptococcus suis]|nr:DUF1642 domain-containing protein [Streptococcus suis]
MNKQEAIKSIDTLNINDIIAGQNVDMVIKNQVIDLISQIHEPQKVVVPKFVAEWIEHCKGRRSTLYFAFTPSRMSRELNEWMALGKNDDIFTRAWLFGYEIEQEKLYTVEIPDPNRPDIATFLYKENGKVFIGTDIFLDEVPNYKWKNEPENQLTESEIKEDFEWAWQFREEVD